VLVEQTRVVDPGGLGSSRGQLESSELRELDSALALVLGL
jgi:mRNA-degrading endonuclease toxin of MazEF toxin-antitoxin module